MRMQALYSEKPCMSRMTIWSTTGCDSSSGGLLGDRPEQLAPETRTDQLHDLVQIGNPDQDEGEGPPQPLAPRDLSPQLEEKIFLSVNGNASGNRLRARSFPPGRRGCRFRRSLVLRCGRGERKGQHAHRGVGRSKPDGAFGLLRLNFRRRFAVHQHRLRLLTSLAALP